MEQIPIGGGERPDNVVPLPGSLQPNAEPEPAEPAPAVEPAIGPLVDQSARIVLGFLSATSAALASTLRQLAPSPRTTEDAEPPEDGPVTDRPSTVGLTVGAATGLAIEVGQAAAKAATSFAETAGPILSWFTNVPVVRRSLADIEGTARQLNDRWTDERPPSEETADAFATKVIPELVNAILDRIDLTELVIDRIDIDRIVDTMDLDAIVARVDVNAVIDRVDLVAITYQLIDEIDLPELIRESTGAVTSESMRIVRMQSAQADQLLTRVVDRILRRRSEPEPDREEQRS